MSASTTLSASFNARANSGSSAFVRVYVWGWNTHQMVPVRIIPGSGEGSGDLRGMVGIVIDDSDTLEGTLVFKPAVCTLEGQQPLPDRLRRNAKPVAQSDDGQRIGHVVDAGHLQGTLDTGVPFFTTVKDGWPKPSKLISVAVYMASCSRPKVMTEALMSAVISS